MDTPAQSRQQPLFGDRLSARLQAATITGFMAILVNTAILIAADHLHIVTTRGGLLTRLLKLIGSSAPKITTTWGFQQFFHIASGVGMAVAHAISFGDMPISAVLKGLFTAAFVWFLNACIILPIIGQGFGGCHVLTWLGMLIFALAHTVFFVLTALLYERPRRTACT